MKFTFISLLIFLRLIHRCSGQVKINTTCNNGRIVVNEVGTFNITCLIALYYTPVTWMLHYANGSSAEVGTCINFTCTTRMIGANLTSNITASELQFLRINRSMGNGVLQCSQGKGIQKTNCTLVVQYPAVLEDCNIWNNSETKSVSGFCRVPKVYRTSNRYYCHWYEHTGEKIQQIANGTVSLTPFNDSSGLLYYQGNCSLIKTNFSLMQSARYSADFVPGAVLVTAVVSNSTRGTARSGLTTIYSTANDIVSTVYSTTDIDSKVSDGPDSSDSSFLIWCIIGVTFFVIVISSAVIIVKCRRRTSKKTDGEINYENDVIVNLTGPHIATSIPIQERTGKNRAGDEVTSAGGDYEAMIENDTYAPTGNREELTSDLNTNLTRDDSNDAQTPVSGGDVYAVVNKTSDRKTSDVVGDVYAVANKSLKKTSSTITDVFAGANGANEKGSDAGGDVYAVVNKTLKGSQ